MAFDFGGLPSPEQTLIAKTSSMAAAKGFARIGVTKGRCMTAVALGTPRSTSCYLLATMLNDTDMAEPQGKEPVRYYRVADVRHGEAASSLTSVTPPATVIVALATVRSDRTTPAVPAPVLPPFIRPLPVALRSMTAPVPQQSAAEIERARLESAAASSGGGSVIVR